MVSSKIALPALLVAALAVGGVAATTGMGHELLDSPDSFDRTELASFQQFQPVCADGSTAGGPAPANTSTVSHPAPGGRKLSHNTTVPVAHPDTELSAEFESLAPHRYVLRLDREVGSEPANCSLVARYNATLNVTRADLDGYTVIVTVDDDIRTVLWADSDGSGVSNWAGPPRRASETGADANATDAQGGSSGGAG